MAFLPTTRISDVYSALKHIINILTRPIFLDPTTGRLNVNNVTTVAAITTCSTVTSVSQYSGFSTRDNQVFPIERTNWAQNVRARIT